MNGPSVAGDTESDEKPRGRGPSTSVGPREQRRRRRIETGREQILDVAEELFARNGYRGTSLQQVADRCEYSVGGIYQFFENKAALLAGVMDRRGGAQMELMRAAADQDGPALDVMVGLVRTIIEYFRKYPHYGLLASRTFAPGVEMLPVQTGLDNGLAAAFDVYAGVLRRGQEQGEVRTGDPGALARLLSGLVTAHHTMDESLVGPVPSSIEDDDFFGLLRDAFARRAG